MPSQHLSPTDRYEPAPDPSARLIHPGRYPCPTPYAIADRSCDVKDTTMPKMKTSKTAAKRFSKTGTGKLRRLQQNRQHLFEKKPSTQTRRLDGMVAVHPGDAKKIKRLLGER